MLVRLILLLDAEKMKKRKVSLDSDKNRSILKYLQNSKFYIPLPPLSSWSQIKNYYFRSRYNAFFTQIVELYIYIYIWETTVSLSIRGRSWILNLSPKYLITQKDFNSWYIIKDFGTLIIFTYQVKKKKKIKRKKEKQSSAMFFLI